MLLFLGLVLLLSGTFAQQSDSEDTNEDTTLRPRSTTRRFTTPDYDDTNEDTTLRPRSTTRRVIVPPTTRILQLAIRDAIADLNDMIDNEQNQRNIRLFRRAIEALDEVRGLNFDRATLTQLSRAIRRLNDSNILYNSDQCDRNSGELDYNGLIEDLDGTDTNDNNDSYDADDIVFTSDTARRADRIMDATSEIIEDYCD